MSGWRGSFWLRRITERTVEDLEMVGWGRWGPGWTLGSNDGVHVILGAATEAGVRTLGRTGQGYLTYPYRNRST